MKGKLKTNRALTSTCPRCSALQQATPPNAERGQRENSWCLTNLTDSQNSPVCLSLYKPFLGKRLFPVKGRRARGFRRVRQGSGAERVPALLKHLSEDGCAGQQGTGQWFGCTRACWGLWSRPHSSQSLCSPACTVGPRAVIIRRLKAPLLQADTGKVVSLR